MDCTLKLITAPSIEPVTVAEVKQAAHIDYNNEDTLISTWIKSARELAETFQGRAYSTQIWEMSFDNFPETPLYIPRPPLISIDSIKYYNYLDSEYTFDLGNLIIDTDSQPGRINLAFCMSWPFVTLRSIDSVKIRYTAGNVDVAHIPASVKDAIMFYCAYRNENRAEGEIPQQFFDLLNSEKIYL
jgi:uncharacterized phiE125 gp8 family phage protein